MNHSTLIDGLDITGIVLAGGRARRMEGADKGLIHFRGQPLVQYAIDSLKPLCRQVLINANRSHDSYRMFDCPVFADQTGHYDGPLAGILAGMQQTTSDYFLTVPCDSPLITCEQLQRLLDIVQLYSCDGSVAHDGERLHPVFLLLHRRLQHSLAEYLNCGERKIDRWLAQHKIIEVDFSDQADRFRNVNTPDDLLKIEQNI